MTTGGVTTGAATIVPEGADVRVAVPKPVVAVSLTTIFEPMSAATGMYVG